MFVSAFRRRVMRAAAAHGGVVDKFLGDGALILFGVPAEREPMRSGPWPAGGCCWTWWSAGTPSAVSTRRCGSGSAPISAKCSAASSATKSRLEFTVLGESVNITARIEQSTKEVEEPFLASLEIVEAGGRTGTWAEVAHEPLRGMTRAVHLMAPVHNDRCRLPCAGRLRAASSTVNGIHFTCECSIPLAGASVDPENRVHLSVRRASPRPSLPRSASAAASGRGRRRRSAASRRTP